MRDLFLLAIVMLVLVRAVGSAQAGILGWTWLTLMTPQTLVWGFFADLPLNLIVAIVTISAWFMSRERKRMPVNAAIVLWFAFTALITFTTFFALASDLAWPRWNLAIKVMLLGLMIVSIMTTQVRIHALVWVIVLSLGYLGVKGGIFTLLTGGHFHVLAPAGSIGDNNNLALALCMVLPLMNYLRLQSANRFVRLGTIAAMGFTALGVLGTYSRGGVVGLAIMMAYLLWHSKNRFVIALVVITIGISAIAYMPANWAERMGSIQTAGADSSFQDRVQAWRTEFNIALARPLTGGGFNASTNSTIYQKYSGDPSGWPRAAHSIYFEVLGDHGFIGLALYLLLLGVTWHYAGTTRRKARREPGFRWIGDLAAMIQVSLVSFMIVGASLSMAYYDMFYLLLGITLVLRQMVIQRPAQMPFASPLAIPAVTHPTVSAAATRAMIPAATK